MSVQGATTEATVEDTDPTDLNQRYSLDSDRRNAQAVVFFFRRVYTAHASQEFMCIARRYTAHVSNAFTWHIAVARRPIWDIVTEVSI